MQERAHSVVLRQIKDFVQLIEDINHRDQAHSINSEEFAAIKQRLEMLIHPPTAETDEEPYPIVPLLTDVRDSVE